MPLSYHWNQNSLQIVCRGNMHMLPADDIRYPWALIALSQSEQAVLAVLDGDVPVFVDQGTQWNASFLPEGENASNNDAWELIDFFEDSVQACAAACEYLLANPDVECVRVCNENDAEIFALSRNIELAVS